MRNTWLQHEYALHYSQPVRNTPQNMPWDASYMLVRSWTYTYDRDHCLTQRCRTFTMADIPWG